jgi:hypothetical protein
MQFAIFSAAPQPNEISQSTRGKFRAQGGFLRHGRAANFDGRMEELEKLRGQNFVAAPRFQNFCLRFLRMRASVF